MNDRIGGHSTRRGSRRFQAALIFGLIVALATLTLASLAPATFPGHNGRIAFVRKQRGRLPAIYTMRADGSQQRRLVQAAQLPQYSADGRKLMFVPYQNKHLKRPGLYVVRANGSHIHRIPHTSGALDGSFAPSGRKIAFTLFHQKSISSDVYTMRLDGSHRQRLTHLHGAGGPTYSPNGRWIAFAVGGPPCDVLVMHANGTGQRFLTKHDTGSICDFGPDFSPNGRKLVFSRSQPGHPPQGAIYSIRRDGRHLRRLYHAKSVTIGNAVFSPRGGRVAFSRRLFAEPVMRAFTIKPDGSHRTPLGRAGVWREQLNWGVRP